MLDENRTQRLCLVVAPAGWGKTTLLTEWARHAGDRELVAWVTLDETDDEPHRFWTYLVVSWCWQPRWSGSCGGEVC
jgi:LuxR family maltose regulon positive regulatory protein